MRQRDTLAAIYILLSEDDLHLLMQTAAAIYILLQRLPWTLLFWKLSED
jgi:hypothetical protein